MGIETDNLLEKLLSLFLDHHQGSTSEWCLQVRLIQKTSFSAFIFVQIFWFAAAS
jgi:hypothetical protein